MDHVKIRPCASAQWWYPGLLSVATLYSRIYAATADCCRDSTGAVLPQEELRRWETATADPGIVAAVRYIIVVACADEYLLGRACCCGSA